MNVVIVAPHQDDEIISSFGYIYSTIASKKNKLSVIFATNGDYQGKCVSQTRYYESLSALQLCGVTSENIYYMGYADTGMQKDDSFLYRLYQLDATTILPSGCSEKTYHPVSLNTVHKMFHGLEADYTKKNFVQDLRTIISCLNPEMLIIPSIYDYHGDHAALSLFFKKYILPTYTSQTYYYLVHTENDLIWPTRDMDLWQKPSNLPDFVWQSREVFSYTRNIVNKKFQAIQKFKSQNPYALNSYLLSFAKKEEIFFTN